jgi:predicted MPP superfamily phosphohydrolase
MGTAARFALFLAIVLGVWSGFHVWAWSRLAAFPAFTAVPRGARLAAFALLWLSYPLGRVLLRNGWRIPGEAVELAGAVWMGVLFILCSCLLVADLATGFGFLLPERVLAARRAGVALGLAFSLFAIGQGLRGPRVVRYETKIAGLDPSLDGLRIVQLSDLHLGTLLGRRWLEARIGQVEALRPDLLLVTGDLIDSEVAPVRPLAPLLRRLHAPLGVWGVTGNHEFYAGLGASTTLYADARIRLLRDTSAEVRPGLVLVGVDDLSARRQLGLTGDPLSRAFLGAPEGTRILLSHSPLRVTEAARAGAKLMLSGHTHAGQIWPFTYLCAIPYPHQAGLYREGDLQLIVHRGTGTWGPPMRLFLPSEIVEVTLRVAAGKDAGPG